jgi:hypothetical protein
MSKSGILNFDTPKKACIKGAADYMDAKGIPYFHTNLFAYHNISKEAEWAIIKQDNKLFDRTLKNNEVAPETQGQKPKLIPKDLVWWIEPSTPCRTVKGR